MPVSIDVRRHPGRAGRPSALRNVSWIAALAVLTAVAACTPREPDAWLDALLEARVPKAAAGDPSWIYAQRARADVDGDGAMESAILICDVMLDAAGAPLWEDGHRWQVYVEEADGTRTHLYAKFLPNGTLTADLTEGEDGRPTITLVERTPERVGVYELRYEGPRRVSGVGHFERAIDPRATFQGSSRP